MTGWVASKEHIESARAARANSPSATYSATSLHAIFAYPAAPALRWRLVDLNDFGHLPPRRPDLLGDADDPGPELVGIADQLPPAVAGHDDGVGWSHARLFFNEAEIDAH